MKLKIIHTNSENRDFIALGEMMDEELDNYINPTEVEKFEYSLENIENCFVAYDGKHPVGCGCFKPFKLDIAELHKIYTIPTYRGKGICSAIVKNIERVAKSCGYKTLILETSKELQSSSPSAKVYEKLGYRIVKNFPPYMDENESICMAKDI